MRLSEFAAQGIRKALGGPTTLQELPLAYLKRKRVIPADFKFGPDLCLTDGTVHYLIYTLSVSLIPEWVAEAQKQLAPGKNVFLVILANHTPDVPGAAIAGGVAKECLKHGYGLAVESPDGVFLVFPPTYRIPRFRPPAVERDHIPLWIRDELLRCRGFSDYLQRAFKRFNEKYVQLISAGPPSHDDESEVLLAFATTLARGDRRLFFPTSLLSVLQDWERSGGNKGKRDHFFHTFNNLLFGYVILGQTVTKRRKSDIPDRYIASPAGISSLNLWESLWALTCLFHDPGYMGEDFWGTFAFSIGIEKTTGPVPDLPDAVIRAINNAWETDYLAARNDLVELFKRVSGCWEPAGFGEDASLAFDPALRRAYFSRNKCGHSLISGLYLIRRCQNDEAAKHQHYHQPTALKACLIAGLGMMFHDPHSRETLCASGIPSVPFEQLPYATVLMFADALQDDRRDIRTSEFPARGVLESVRVDEHERTVTARVCLPRIPIEGWPWRIVEYESVLAWVNRASETKFAIDYRSAAEI